MKKQEQGDNWISKALRGQDLNQPQACNCVGPQNGEPVCPCRMRYVKIIGGRYIETHDLGPATKQNLIFPPSSKAGSHKGHKKA